MKITIEAHNAQQAIAIRVAQLTLDIDAGQRRATELEADAEQSESAKKAIAVVRLGIDRARKLRESLNAMDRTLRGCDDGASVELNDNECALFGSVYLTQP